MNQRRRSQRIYSPPPLTARASTHLFQQFYIVAQSQKMSRGLAIFFLNLG
ncbi:hypothetical protein PL9631_780016 [Planktothrix paucivesiculata PCC 9631]|uniref:Uncharacterized protein n=1 Tax=Planktothrix paucivesiculata PCC 9631 TaxID=671071 RepID=A0A7Z9BWU1_9CYAN|nr:hypothetical protein PL9631_780016 [Planktothrix paucivesiculata PCC 9631]